MDTVKIRVDASGMGSIEVNGHDISNHVNGISIESAVGELTKVRLTLVTKDLDFEAEVRNVEAVPA